MSGTTGGRSFTLVSSICHKGPSQTHHVPTTSLLDCHGAIENLLCRYCTRYHPWNVVTLCRGRPLRPLGIKVSNPYFTILGQCPSIESILGRFSPSFSVPTVTILETSLVGRYLLIKYWSIDLILARYSPGIEVGTYWLNTCSIYSKCR